MLHFRAELLCSKSSAKFCSYFLKGPLREEAASWAEKLKGVGEVLDLWLETQDLWLDLEAVFSEHITSKELPQVSTLNTKCFPFSYTSRNFAE